MCKYVVCAVCSSDGVFMSQANFTKSFNLSPPVSKKGITVILTVMQGNSGYPVITKGNSNLQLRIWSQFQVKNSRGKEN